MGNWGSIILTAIASAALVYYILPDSAIYLRRDFVLNNPAQIVSGAVAITRNGVLWCYFSWISRWYINEHDY